MALSGRKTVTTPGTAVQLSTQNVKGPLMVKALSTNTGLVYVGNNGANDVSASDGYHLSANEEVVFKSVYIKNIFIDAAVGAEGVAWLWLGE